MKYQKSNNSKIKQTKNTTQQAEDSLEQKVERISLYLMIQVMQLMKIRPFFIFTINIVSITSVLIKLMDDDQADWQNQYDRIFLQFPVIVPQKIYELLPIQPTQKIQWQNTSTILPELSSIYSLLQNFISDHRNWTKRSCNELQIGTIEQKINNLMTIIQYQKHYGCQLWQINERRIQASVIHFYILVKMFVVALIPTNCNSLIHANSKDKLMVEMIKLEALINQIIAFIKPVHSFMYGHIFQNQKELTDDFFKEFFEFFKKMPKIKKESMNMIPKIMEFVNVCLQIDAIQIQPKFKRKTKSVSTNKKRGNINDRSNNFINKYLQDEENNKEKREFFRFDERIRAQTQFRNQKKLTVTSIETKQRSQSNDKSRSPSLDRSLTLFQSQRLKRSTMIETPNRQPEGRNRMPTANVNVRRSRQRTRRLSIQEQQCEQQRDTKVKKKKIPPLPIKLAIISEQINLDKGKSRGWGIIREYLNHKIVERKIKKLILL